MSGERTPLVAWDSCVFLAWFNNEKDKPLAAIEYYLEALKAKRLTLLVSAIVAAEVLDRPAAKRARTRLKQMLGLSNIQTVDVDMRVADKAAQLRERICKLVDDGKWPRALKAPDALIAATAVVYRADVLHTFDPHLIALSKTPLLGGLEICVPTLPGDWNPDSVPF